RQRGLDVHVLDRIESGPKPELVRALGAIYHTGRIGNVGFEPDIIIECTGVGQLVVDAIESIGAGGVVCLTGVGRGGSTASRPAPRRTSLRPRSSRTTSWSAASTPTSATGTRPARLCRALTAPGWPAWLLAARHRRTSRVRSSEGRTTSRSSFSFRPREILAQA